MMSDVEIKGAVQSGILTIEPFADESLQPASYDLRVGAEAFISGDTTKTFVADRGLLLLGRSSWPALPAVSTRTP